MAAGSNALATQKASGTGEEEKVIRTVRLISMVVSTALLLTACNDASAEVLVRCDPCRTRSADLSRYRPYLRPH